MSGALYKCSSKKKLTEKAKITQKAKITLDFCNRIGYNINCKVKCGRFKLESESEGVDTFDLKRKIKEDKMVSGQIKASAEGYFLQQGETGLKNYLEKEVKEEKITSSEANDIYKEFTGTEKLFEESRKEEKTVSEENENVAKTAEPKSAEVIKTPQPAVTLTKEEEKEVKANNNYSEGYERRLTNSPAASIEPKEPEYEYTEYEETEHGNPEKEARYAEKYAGMNYADLGNEAARIEAEFLIGERDEIDYDEITWLKKESRANTPDAVKGVYAQKEAEYAEKRYNEAYNRLFGGGEVSGQYIQLQQFANIYPEAFSFETDENNNIKEIKVDTSKINADDKTKMKIKDACETVSPWLEQLHEGRDKAESLYEQADAYKDSAKYKEADYDSTLAINYRISDLHQKANKSLYDYAVTGDKRYMEAAQTYLDTANEMAENNKDIIAPDSWFEDILASTASQLPQYKHQIGENLEIYILGGVAKIAGLPGLEVAHVFAGAKHGYEQTMGSAFYELINMGLDEEAAKELASSEAILGSLIEMGDSALDVFGIGAGIAAVKGGESAVKTALKALKAYVGNVGGEGVEEGLQASIAMARNRLAEKVMKGELNPEDINVLTLAEEVFNHKYTKEDFKEIGENVAGAIKSSVIMGGAPVVIGGTTQQFIDTYLKSEGNTSVKANPKSYSEAIENLIKSGKATDVGVIYKAVIKNSDNSTVQMVKAMTPAERVYFRAGAQGLSPTDASIRAKGLDIDQKSAWEAWEKGNTEFETGNGEAVELLLDATDYLDSTEDSKILSDSAEDTDIDKDKDKEYTKEQRDADIQAFVDGEKTFDEVQDAYAYLYADLVNSNKRWKWREAVPGYKKISKKEKTLLKKRAEHLGLFPKLTVRKQSYMHYGTVNFSEADLVNMELELPQYLWKESNAKQFAWLNKQIGGAKKGYTWHHSEMPGVMQLVPFGIHNITTHNGGRSPGMWAYIEKR